MTIAELVQIVGQAISTWGFPIVMCAVMFWYMNKERQDHKEEVTQLTTAVNNNTAVIEKLLDRMGG